MTTHRTALIASLGMILGCGGLAAAGAAVTTARVMAQENETEIVAGTIEKVNAESNEFVLKVNGKAADDSKEITVKVNEKTRYTLDGKDSTMGESLKEGRKATVTHTDGLASMVEVRTEK